MSTATDTLSFRLLGAVATPIATDAETGWSFEQFRLDLQPGARSPHHTIPAVKVFVVTAGTVRLTIADRTVDAGAGSACVVPAGTAHHYSNASGSPAALVVTVAGTGQLEFLRGMGELARDGAPDPEAVRRHAAAHGVALLPGAQG